MSKRSPGSVIKPLIVYAPAIEAGWSIDKTVDDSPADYNGWKPTDFDNQWRGQIPMYTALANSYNIPAINTYQAIGPKVGNALGREFGLDLSSKMMFYRRHSELELKRIHGKLLRLIKFSQMAE